MQISNKEQKLSKLKTLVEKFSNNIDEYKNPAYNEANLRIEFLNPFFELLDWDVRNEQNFHINYKEVLVEETIDINGSKKAPDYTFRIGGQTKFYVEAKKPSIDIKDSIEPAFQVKRYGHSAKLSISVLTDFEEFAIYDTRKLPHKNDKPQKNRIYYYKFNQYIEKFDEIYNLLSKPAILQGSFEKFEKEDKYRKGNETVDEGILDLVSSFREKLAKNIAKNNKNIDVFSLNKAVIKIIDRILFLRIAEDKNIEVYKTLLNIAQSLDIYKQLKKFFVQADKRYNSELFKYFKQIDDIIIDDKILKEIITDLYEDCPYEFSVIPVSILGSMYEQFLGKAIHITPSNLVKIEDKPEVKKAGGVYYTPEYIVKYIVENTVGKKIEGLTPKQIEKIKIVDPACGSGSFLIGAYQYLLDYHLKYYTKDENIETAKNKKLIKQTKDGYILSIPEKQKILTNNIFGVDIDQQAVEVAKFSLLLKLMETEKQDVNELIPYAQAYSDIKLLPNLNKNIQCGNSLIGTDYYTNANMALIEQDEMQKINAFDWDKSFPEIFANGGFDCVIGNPPYFNIQTLGAKSTQAQYIQNKYSDIWQDKSDILFYFINQALNISKDSVGYIVSNAFLFSDKAKNLRNKILADNRLEKIVNFEKQLIFKNAGITTCIILFNKKPKLFSAITLKDKIFSEKDLILYINNEQNSYNVKLKKDSVFALTNEKISNIIDKIDSNKRILRQIFKIGKGMETAANDIFCFAKYPYQIPKKFIKKKISGENINRYHLSNTEEYIIYFEDVKDFKSLPISIQEHLTLNKKILSDRATVRNEGREWWKYSRPMHKEFYKFNKIWCSYRAKTNEFCLDESNDYIGLTNTTVIFGTNENYSLKFLLALLNSKLLTFRYKYIGKQTGSGVYEYFENGVGKLPVIELDMSNTEQKQQHDELVKLADQMIQIQQKINSAKTDLEKGNLQKIANSIDDKIDNIVYKLYNLTEEEIKIIENNI